jgi:hypothetical protein
MIFSNKLTLTTKIIKGGRILQEYQAFDPVLETNHSLIRWIIDLRDQQVRECLIKLGWTPPDRQEPDIGENLPLKEKEIG